MASADYENGNRNLDGDTIAVMLQEKIHSVKPVRILKIEQQSADSPEGENFASSIHKVVVHCVLANGRRKAFTLIVKQELLDLRAFTRDESSCRLFRQETHAYTRILSHMELLMDEFNDKRDTLWAQFYGYIPFNTVVLEDLTQLGFATYDRRAMLDTDHVLLVMRSLGRFHAMAIVLKSKGMIGENDKGTNTIATDNETIERLYESGLIVLSDAVEETYGPEWKDVADKLRAQIPILINKLKQLNASYDPRFEVLNHGDMWNCNVLFKHMEYTNIPVSVKFVDFQVMHLNSFIWDVTHFVNTCMHPRTLRENRPSFMKAYQESLAWNLKFFSHKGYVPTYDDVMSESRRLLYAEFALRVIVRPVITFSLPDKFDLKMLMNKKPEEALNRNCFTDPAASAGIKEDLQWFIEQKAL